MKLLITTITMIFISFGASASSQRFDIIEKNIPARECVKALENGKYVGKAPNGVDSMYLLDGYLYQFKRDIRQSVKNYQGSLLIRDCMRSNKIY